MSADELNRIRSGDERALADLLAREWDGLVRYLTTRTPSPDAAQDAAQETFVRLWERRERWRPGSARALLFRIAANVATDARRRADVRGRWRRDARVGDHARPSTPAEELDASEARARLRGALESLAPKRREVFELVRFHGLSYAEVAETLDLSPQTVANHMSLALRDLRVALADWLEAPASDPTSAGQGSGEPRSHGSRDAVSGPSRGARPSPPDSERTRYPHG